MKKLPGAYLEVARALEAAGVEAVVGHNGAPRTLKRVAPDFDGVAIRLSIAHYNSRADIDAAVKCLEGVAGERPAPQRRGRGGAATRRGSSKRGQSRSRK